MRVCQTLIYLLFSSSLVQSQAKNKGGFYSKDQIDTAMLNLKKEFDGTENNIQVSGNLISVGPKSDLPKAKKIVIFGGLHGSLAAAAEVLGLARLYCENIVDKKYLGLYKNFQIQFVPVVNTHYYNEVYDNKTDDNSELEYRGTNTCNSNEEIDPDRNFEYAFKNLCNDPEKYANTGSYSKNSEVVRNFYNQFFDTLVIINIQDFGSNTLIGYASQETKLSKADKYTYDLLINGEYSSIGSDSKKRKTGQMVDSAMNNSIYAVIYNTKSRVSIDMNKLSSTYSSSFDKIFGGLELALKSPLIDLRKAKENHKASENSPSEITFNVYLTNFYPFDIKGKLIIDIKISEESSTLELKYEKITAKKKLKYSTTKKDFEDYIELEDEWELDTENGFYGIVLDEVNFPKQTEIGFKIVFTRTISGSIPFTAEISFESLDNMFADVDMRSGEQYVDTTNKADEKDKAGVLLLMFLVFVLIVTTIFCLLISKPNRYNRFIY